MTRPGSPNTSAFTKSKSSKQKSKKSKNSEKSLEELGKEFRFIITDSNQDQKIEDKPPRKSSNSHTSNLEEIESKYENSNKNSNDNSKKNISNLKRGFNDTRANSVNKTSFTAVFGSENLSSKEPSAGENSNKIKNKTGKLTFINNLHRHFC